MDDAALLREFVGRRSQSAFRQLVERHTNLVYACALQRLHDAHAAQDVTQAVFLTLALKAKDLRPERPLAGWLFVTTGYVASNYHRGEQRRKEREMRAVEHQIHADSPSSPAWEDIQCHLNAGLESLGATDRTALLLRFYESASHREIGAALKLNEETAKKRVNRALEKLRCFLMKKGVVLSVTGLAATLSAHVASATPPGLAATVSAAVLTGTGETLAATSTLMLAKGALKAMFIAKVKTVSLAAAACLVVAGTGIVAAKHLAGSSTGLVADQTTPAAVRPDTSATPSTHRLATPAQPVTEAVAPAIAPATPVVVWGKAEQGVQAGVAMVTPQVAVDAPIEFEIHLRNQTDRQVSLANAGALTSAGPPHKGWTITVIGDRKTWQAKWVPVKDLPLEPGLVELAPGEATRLSVAIQPGAWEFVEVGRSGRPRPLPSLPVGHYSVTAAYTQGRPSDAGWWGTLVGGPASLTVGNPPPEPAQVPVNQVVPAPESIEQQKARESKMKQDAGR